MDRQALKWFFSGRRGLHLWINDRVFSELGNRNRVAIADYLTLLKGEHVLSLAGSPLFKQRVKKLVTVPFLVGASPAELLESGIGQESVNRSGLDQAFTSGD